MSDSGITVTYSGSDALLDSAAFSHLIGTFSHHLPLRNLHWKPSASYTSSNSTLPSPFSSTIPQPTSIRTIQSLSVRLEPIADTLLRTKLKPETRHLIQRTLLERPFCHLYFVVCDDSDVYRSQIRNDIRSWLSTIQNSPTLSAASVTAKGFQGIESFHYHKNGSTSSLNNGSSTPRAGTPPIRPDTPSRETSADEVSSPNLSSSKDKLPPPSPEYLIVVVTPPDGSSLPLSSVAPAVDQRTSTPPTSFKSLSDPSEKTVAARSGPVRFFSSSNSSKGSVIDKVKADFNTSRRERVVHLTRLPPLHSEGAPLSGHSDPTIFADLQTRLKECVSATFDAVVEMQGDVVKREGQKKNIPGWNFCKWMAGLECVASTFEGVGLYSDALAQYEEIESSFLQCLQERNLPFFSSVGGTFPGDDSAPLLDIGKKNYRELILRNEVTLFDFRNYVFAKRAILLGKLGRVSQVMNETPIFLSRVAAMLQGESLPRHFLESWTFSCSIDVVEQCQAWLIERGDVSAPGQEHDIDEVQSPTSRSSLLSAAFHSAKAELLELARRQLDKIGIAVGHLPRAIPFTLSLSHGGLDVHRKLPPLPDSEMKDGNARVIVDKSTITRQELLSSIESREVFDLHYVSLTERVLASWSSGGRQRNALRLRCVLASLDFCRERYSQAYAKFTALPEPYAEGGWSIIEASHLAKQLECHAQLGKPYDRAWVSVLLALLETCPQQLQGQLYEQSKQKQDSSLRWLEPSFLYLQLREQTQSFAQEVPISRFAPIRIHVQDQVVRVADSTSQDGTEIKVKVENRSGCPVEVDDLRVCVLNGVGKEMWFTSGKVELGEGEKEVSLYCLSFNQPGKYVVDVSQVRLSKVIVQYLHRKQIDLSRNSTFVDVLEDGGALHLTMDLSKEVWLDRSRTCTMNIWTGRNEMQRLTIRLLYKDSGEPVKGFSDATLEQDESIKSTRLTVDPQDSLAVLEHLPAQTVVKLSVPLHDFVGAADGTLTFLAELDYWNKTDDPAQPSRKRQIRTEIRLSIGLPLGVNVQDFFRSDQLFSKFLISAGSGGFLRLGKVHLECEGVKEKESGPFSIHGSSQKVDTIVTPTQTASYLFAIQRLIKGALNRNLRLTLSFRTLHEEAIQKIQYHLDQTMSGQQHSISNAHKRCLQRALSTFVTTQADMSVYLNTGRLQFAPRSELQWKQIFQQWAGLEGEENENQIYSIVQDTLRATEEGITVDTPLEWRHLSLIVDVPRMHIVNAVTIDLEDTDQAVRVGQVVKAKINIATNFYWDDKEEKVTKIHSNHRQVHHAEETDEEDDDAASFQDAKSEASSMSRAPSQDAKSESSSISRTPSHDEIQKERKSIYLSIDIHCDFVNWLLVGSKRTVIKVTASSSTTTEDHGQPQLASSSSISSNVEVSLIAIKSGQLCLPSVTIWPLADLVETTPSSHAHRDKQSNAIQYEEEKKRLLQVQSMSCDSHITNEAQKVTVLPALQGAERRTYWMNL